MEILEEMEQKVNSAYQAWIFQYCECQSDFSKEAQERKELLFQKFKEVLSNAKEIGDNLHKSFEFDFVYSGYYYF